MRAWLSIVRTRCVQQSRSFFSESPAHRPEPSPEPHPRIALRSRSALRLSSPPLARIAPRAVVTRRVVAKAVAEASEATKLNKAEWNSLGSVCAVLGSQWGDEGKGKLVDILAQVRPP